MTKRLEAAADAAIAILEDGGAGSWDISDAILILRAGLGREIAEEDRLRVEQIAPQALEEAYLIVEPHDKVKFVPGRGPASWVCDTCGKKGSGVVGDQPGDYPCLEET